jgi:uncharacterized protein (TIGR00369 family)
MDALNIIRSTPMPNVPDGFTPHFRKSPVTDPWEPLYSRRTDEGVIEIGTYLAPPHCNARGMAHGGVIASLADNAMGLTYAGALEQQSGVVTVSLNIDYAATGKLGDWLQITPRLIRSGKNMGFVDALVTADGAIVARASATFRNLA